MSATTAHIPGDKLRPALRRRDINVIVGLCEPIAWKATDGLYIPGHDRDDLLQAARIGIVNAIRDFNGTEAGHFIAFAQLCARRQVLTEVKLARADKRVLNILADRLEQPTKTQDGRGDLLGDTIIVNGSDPHDQVVIKHELLDVAARVSRLTATEREGIAVVLNGDVYNGDKRTDNAIQRARRKLREATYEAESTVGVLLVCRDLHRTERAAIAAASRARPGCKVLDCKPRKVRNGRIVAPQGRRSADGTLGRLVWALTVEASG